MTKFIAVLSFLFMPALHPMHVSVTEIEFDEKDKALEIMMRVFIDDLETTFKTRYNQPEMDILNPKGKTVDEMMSEYLQEHFMVSLDNKKQPFHFLGHEKDGDAFIFYIEVAKVKKWTSIQIQNNILTDTFDDQSNLVHVTVSDNVRSLRLTKSNPSGILTFN
jgi:hypothetical protein